MKKLIMIFEGLLFLSGDEGLTVEQLGKAVEISDNSYIEEVLEEMMKKYEDEYCGIELVRFGSIYKFITKVCIHPYAQRVFQHTTMKGLSNAALETLAIIAYRQPITRVEIEEIRGVSSDVMIRKLLGRDLICECGRSDAPGKPFLYKVTNTFMDAFQLKSLEELPQLELIQEDKIESLFEE